MQKSPSFGRHRGPRKALLRNLTRAFVENERIKTTLSKAKALRPLVEKAITIGKKGDLHSRRLLMSRYPCKKTVSKIIDQLSPRFKDRMGGYTRIVKLGFRAGDQASIAYLEFVDYKVSAPKLKKQETTETGEKAKPLHTAESNRIKKQKLKKMSRKRKHNRYIQTKSRRINRK